MSDYKNVLVALDLMGDHEHVLLKALAVTKADAKINLIYVNEPVYVGEMVYAASVDFERQAVESARQQFDKLGEEFGIPADQRFIETGRSAAEIHRKAKELEVDLIVVGSHGRHGLQLLLGSTANSVLHGALSDVLAVRLPGETIEG